MDFYLDVCSDASSGSFEGNYAGDFKALLTKEIDLKNIEYSVAVSSVGRYYETPEQDVVFIIEKRDVVAAEALPLTVHTTYPATSDVEIIKQKYDDFIKNGDPIYACISGEDKFSVELNVDGKKETFEIYSNPIYKSTLAQPVSYKSDWFEDIRFELSDMLDVGIMTVICSGGKTRNVRITFPE